MSKKNTFEIIEITEQTIWNIKQVKNYLRVSHDYDDELIGDLIETAINAAENFISMSLLLRKVKFTSHLVNNKSFYLKFNPIKELLNISLQSNNETKQLSSKSYHLDLEHSVIYLDQYLHNNSLIIEYIAGFKSSEVPKSIKQGILLHVCEMYDRTGDNNSLLTNEIKNLYFPFKQIRI